PLTSPGAGVGTPGFMSPEQVNGEPVSARSDLFSLGCVLYRMATGANPFTGPNRTAVLYATLQHEPPPASALNLGIPGWLSALIARLLAKRPEGRPESARCVADELGGGGVASAGTPARRACVPLHRPPLPAYYVHRPREEERLAADLLRE